jgi:predicted nucleic acid-binding protein
LTYADTSFLISLYTADANTVAAAQYAPLAEPAFPLTPFGRLELINAIHLRCFRGENPMSEAQADLDAVAADVASGILALIPTPAAMFERAQTLAAKHTARLGVRSLDILHVAVALELRAEAFFTFDRRQARLARAEGLTTPVRIR